MEFYQYQPLPHEDSIRLVAILPETLNDPSIHCIIITWRLLSPLRFEALSYTWGDTSDRVPIFCGDNSAKIEVTRNCHNALRQLRLEDTVRILWIDAICIDQENIPERTAQIRIMDRIYNCADQIVVYLGEETTGTQLVFKELHEIELFGSSGRALPSIEIVQELDNILLRPWFTRVWVLQEVYVAKSVVIQCGSAHASLGVLTALVWGHHRITRITTIKVPFVLRPGSRSEMRLVGSTYTWGREVAIHLWKVLAETRYFLATDPRDRIFALRAFIPYNGPEIDQMMRYDRSTETVFTDVAVFLLPHVKLLLLLAARFPHSLNMPSWVPDWSQNTYSHIWWAIGYTLDDLYDRFVSERSIEPTLERASKIHNNSYLGRSFTLKYVKCGVGSCQESHAVLYVQGLSCSRIVSLGSTFDFKEARDLCFESILQISRVLKGSKEPKAYQNEELLSCSHVPPEIFEALLRLNENQLFRLLFRHYTVAISDEEWKNMPFTRTEASEILEESLHGCQISLDDTGSLGIVPEGAREGDTICVFEGSTPYAACLLRQRRERGWILVSGDCYLLGLMDEFSDDDWPLLFMGNDKAEFEIW